MQSIAKQVTLALTASHKNSEIPWVFGGATGMGAKIKKRGRWGEQMGEQSKALQMRSAKREYLGFSLQR